MTDISVCPDTGAVTSVQCGEGETYDADAVVCAVGINGAKGIVRAAPALSKYPFFANMMNLRSVDALAVRLYLDRRVRIPYQRYRIHPLGYSVSVHANNLPWRVSIRSQVHGSSAMIIVPFKAS